MTVKICTISDTHMQHRALRLPPADVLVHAGDACGVGTLREWSEFCEWWHEQRYTYKVFVAGNHDWVLERDPEAAMREFQPDEQNFYLQDSGARILGLNFWGSPWQPPFNNWAFNRDSKFRAKQFAKIPHDTDMLVTHVPPFGTQDVVEREAEHLGCQELAYVCGYSAIKTHIFGHIHSGYGVSVSKPVWGPRISVNASQLNEQYRLVNAPVVVLV